MELFSKRYLSLRTEPHFYDFLRYDFRTLYQQFGGVVGLQTAIPKLVPLSDSQTA
jgi:hypothetical protein